MSRLQPVQESNSESEDLEIDEQNFDASQSMVLNRYVPDQLAKLSESKEDPQDSESESSLESDAQEVNNIQEQYHSIQKSVSKQTSKKKPLKLYRQYDNIYGEITISNYAKTITLHPWFQRLKDIKQLGPLHFKFPHADHSRFNHSIGVAYLARLAGTVLRSKHRRITDREILCLELAGLCHDLGHGPYSHSFDHLLRDIGFKSITAQHEIRSQILIKHLIEDLPELNISAEEIKLIQYFIDTEKYKLIYPNEVLPKHTPGLEQIVSNPVHKLDVDKMDYLLRDAQALRFDMTIDGKLDVRALLKRSQLVHDKKENRTFWMFHIRDQGMVYDLICRRFIFYNNYYLHPDVNAINCMLTDALIIINRVKKYSDCVKLENREQIEKYIQLTDTFFLEMLMNSDDDRLAGARELVKRIVSGKDWYKHLGDFVTNIENLDETSYAELPWEIFTDKSTPTTLLPKIRYHQNGVPINPLDVKNTRRLYLKPDT